MGDYHIRFTDDDTGQYADQIIKSLSKHKHSIALARILRAVFDNTYTAVIPLKDGRQFELHCSSTISERKKANFINPFEQNHEKETSTETPAKDAETYIEHPSEAPEEKNTATPPAESNSSNDFHRENTSSEGISRLNQLMDGLDVFQ